MGARAGSRRLPAAPRVAQRPLDRLPPAVCGPGAPSPVQCTWRLGSDATKCCCALLARASPGRPGTYVPTRWCATALLLKHPPATHQSNQVQALEALLWLDQGCTGLNQAAGKALLALISAEPPAHALIAWACTPPKQRSALQRALPPLAGAFALAFATNALSAAPDWCSQPCGAECGRHLKVSPSAEAVAWAMHAC